MQKVSKLVERNNRSLHSLGCVRARVHLLSPSMCHGSPSQDLVETYERTKRRYIFEKNAAQGCRNLPVCELRPPPAYRTALPDVSAQCGGEVRCQWPPWFRAFARPPDRAISLRRFADSFLARALPPMLAKIRAASFFFIAIPGPRPFGSAGQEALRACRLGG
jgi:hypothetical protein